MSGLEAYKGDNLSKMASVASFFVSRIDTEVDTRINEKLKNTTDPQQQELLRSLPGKIAIANAKQAYRSYQKMIAGSRWKALANRGAQTQRLLWASTSTKNPNYRDVLYLEELIGPDTVNTLPPATIDAFRDHGQVRQSLAEKSETSAKALADLKAAGIDMKQVTQQLEDDGVRLF